MKILFLASYFPKPDNPVMGTWALSQAQALKRQGIELEVVSFTAWVPPWLAPSPGAQAYANCPATFQWPGDVIAHYPRWLYYPVPPLKQWAYGNPKPYLRAAWWSAQHRLRQLIEQFQPDVLFCHHSLPNGWLITQLPQPYQRPLFILEHDFDEIADCDRYPHRHTTMQSVADHAAGLLAVSQRMERDMQRLFPAATTQTHHNGVDLSPPHLQVQPRPAELAARKVVLACALFAERKGIPLLIEAFHRIAAKHPDAILRIIGAGPQECLVQQTIEQLNLHSQVQLIGKKPHAEVLQEMVWADCFALVGWDEPFATVYLEAMAAGKPIICCHDGGITDVVVDAVHGYLVPPKHIAATANALDRMLSDDNQRQTMGQAAYQLVQQHLTWDAKAAQLIELFERHLAAPAPNLSVA